MIVDGGTRAFAWPPVVTIFGWGSLKAKGRNVFWQQFKNWEV